MDIFVIAAAAFAGAVASALLGWLDSHEPWAARKFGASVVRGAVAAAGLGLAFVAVDSAVTAKDLLLAFLSGAGFDAVGNRLAGAMAKKG